MQAEQIKAQSLATISLGGLQWLFFMFANIVVIPISIGHAFHLTPAVTTAMLERSFIYTGLACLMQGLIGHKLPLMEGPAGVWWGVILSIAASASGSGLPLSIVGGSLAVGIIISSILTTIMGAIGLGWTVRAMFTPVVTSTFYFLLGAQLTSVFFRGMLGLATGNQIQPGVALLSIGLVILVMALNIKGKGLISNFALLIGIIVGWIAYRLLFTGSVQIPVPAGNALFQLFPWGAPAADPGIIITIVLTGFISATNTFAALEGSRDIYQTPIEPAQYQRSFAITGISGVISGVLGIIPYAPYVSSLGFLRTTRILDRAPYLLGSGMFVVLGMIPAMGQLFATLPVSVGDAVLFVAYLQLFASALSSLKGITFHFATIYRIATPVLIGLAIMTIPAGAFATVPSLLRTLVQNGLVAGIMLAIILENTVKWQ